ncbi:MAG: ribosomal protein L13e [Infirmifilum sp.]
MSGNPVILSPPYPQVRPVPLRRYKGLRSRVIRRGRGFSLGEIKAINLSVREARLLGIYVDTRRKSVHEENIKALKEYLKNLKAALESGLLPRPTLPTSFTTKIDVSRVFKGKTPAGRRGRGLHSIKYRYTHHQKWKKKHKERLLKKRHEAARMKGGD